MKKKSVSKSFFPQRLLPTIFSKSFSPKSFFQVVFPNRFPQNNCSQSFFTKIVFRNRFSKLFSQPNTIGQPWRAMAMQTYVASACRSRMLKQTIATFLENRFCHQNGVSNTDLFPRRYFTGWLVGWLVGWLWLAG